MLEAFIIYMVGVAATLVYAMIETKCTARNFVLLFIASLVWPVTWLLFFMDKEVP